MQKKKILFLFYRTPLNYVKSNDKRQYLIYSTLKKTFNTRILTFGEENQATNELEPVKLKQSNVKKIFNFLFRLQSPRITHYNSKEFQEVLDRNMKILQPDLIYVEHLLMMQYAIHLKTNAKIIFFNDESNLYVLENNLRGNFYQRLRNIGLANMEITACKRADAILTITETEKNYLTQKGFSDVFTIPFGVDTDYFSFNWELPKDNSILFVGDFSHYPNRQAIKILIENILPELSELGVKLKIVGRNANKIKGLINSYIEVYQNVPDVRPFYYNSSVFVAPIFTGAGLRVKILEAALCGIPLAISPIANLDINLVHREEAYICNSLVDFMTELKYIFNTDNYEKINKMRVKARERIVDKFDERIVTNKIQLVFDKIII